MLTISAVARNLGVDGTDVRARPWRQVTAMEPPRSEARSRGHAWADQQTEDRTSSGGKTQGATHLQPTAGRDRTTGSRYLFLLFLFFFLIFFVFLFVAIFFADLVNLVTCEVSSLSCALRSFEAPEPFD